MIVEKIITAADWAQYGLAGLVIGALFGQVAWFLKELRNKDDKAQKFIEKILTDDRQERLEGRQEHKEITNKLSEAITNLAAEIRNRH